MSRVRVLVGTRKGAFILDADAARRDWSVAGPYFPGWEVYHLKASPQNPDRLYASQSSGWFGQVMQRSGDGGRSWQAVSNSFAYEGIPGTHQWYDGTPARGNSSASGTSSPRSTRRTPFMPGSRMPLCSVPPTVARAGTNSRASASMAPARLGSREQAGCACTPSCSIR
jgi:hypothetical protein